MCEKCKTAQYGSAARANCCKLIRDEEKTFKRWPFWHRAEKMEMNHTGRSKAQATPEQVYEQLPTCYQACYHDCKCSITQQPSAIVISPPSLSSNYQDWGCTLLHPPVHIQNHCFPTYQIPVNDLKLPRTWQNLASIAAPYWVLNYMNYAFWLRAGGSRQRLYGTWSHPRYYKDGINIELI